MSQVQIFKPRREAAGTVYEARLTLGTGDVAQLSMLVTPATAAWLRANSISLGREVAAWARGHVSFPGWEGMPGLVASTIARRVAMAPQLTVSPLVTQARADIHDGRGVESEPIAKAFASAVGMLQAPEEDCLRELTKQCRECDHCQESKDILGAVYEIGNCCADCRLAIAHRYEMGRVLGSLDRCPSAEIIADAARTLCARSRDHLAKEGCTIGFAK